MTKNQVDKDCILFREKQFPVLTEIPAMKVFGRKMFFL